MSRKNAKICQIHDLQGRHSDVILEKGDCDLIAEALLSTYVNNNKDSEDADRKSAIQLADYFKGLARI